MNVVSIFSEHAVLLQITKIVRPEVFYSCHLAYQNYIVTIRVATTGGARDWPPVTFGRLETVHGKGPSFGNFRFVCCNQAKFVT